MTNHKTFPELLAIHSHTKNDNTNIITALDQCLTDELSTCNDTVNPIIDNDHKHVSFFDMDKQIFPDKNRWVHFVNFSKNLQNEIHNQYDNRMHNFWSSYKNLHSTSVIPWIDYDTLNECQFKINEDKDRSHTSCFRKLVLEKSTLQLDNYSGFKQLEKEFPNFKDVISFYKGFFILNKSRNLKNYQAPRPLLLLGKPGIGKTRFAKRLAQVLGTDYKFLDSNSITSGAVLTGHNVSWRGADAGFIFKTLAPCSTLSPIILLDEVDKLSSDRSHSPFSTFHQLLEPENSRSLYDEFLEIEFNASFIIYILTANDIKDIPDSLISRMNIFDIQNPDHEQMKSISQTIFTELLAGSKLFKPKLPHEVLNILQELSPREVYQVLSKNLFHLSANQKKKQYNTFLITSEKKREYKMGF